MRCAALLLLCCALCLWHTHAATSQADYYKIVNDVLAGKDYYAILGVTMDTDARGIKKAYRKLSLQYHPDKNTSPDAPEKFMEVSIAQEVLLDEDQRHTFNDLLLNGVPWQKKFYGRYAHQYGAPDMDVKHVLLFFLALVTLLKYLYQLHHYKRTRSLCYNSPVFKQRLKLRQQQKQYEEQQRLLKGKSSSSKKAPKIKFKEVDTQDLTEEELAELGPELVIVGLEKPQFKDLLIFQLPFFPFDTIWALVELIYYNTVGRAAYEALMDEQLRARAGMDTATDEEWQAWKDNQESKREAMKSGTKWKRYQRYLKKNAK